MGQCTSTQEGTADAPRQSALTDASLNALQQLIQMGFDDNISLDAVKHKGTNIEQCINYILEQNKNATHQKTQEDTKTDDPQTYKDRIDRMLRVVASQRQPYAQSQVHDIYGLFEKEYVNKNGINGFIRDCGEYVMNIDSIYADNVNKCELDGCASIKREFHE
eukprot:725702_1